MILSETATVIWNSRNKKRYVDLGYNFTKMGDAFDVRVCDLTSGSAALIMLSCDYCGKAYTTKMVDYSARHKRSPHLQKDACKDCLEEKADESIRILYGGHSEAFFASNEKRRQTNVERYGCDNPFGNEKIKERIVQTNLNRYGVKYNQQDPGVREKTVKTCRERYGVDNYVELFRGKYIGENSPCWKSDTEYQRHERATHEYISWRAAVFSRDEYTCQCCGDKNGLGHRVEVNAHHIDNWLDNPSERYVIENGITLCTQCHTAFHSKYGKRNTNRDQLEEFLRDNRPDKKIC